VGTSIGTRITAAPAQPPKTSHAQINDRIVRIGTSIFVGQGPLTFLN
jgi:hypothetical protein